MPLILLELNEINFDAIRDYGAKGKLPMLNRLIRQHGVSETVSEQSYELLEPWIQWVTAHTGYPYASHQVFRLGDIVDHDIPQIWEQLEAHGLKVGAISPMNAKNRCCSPAFFVPDPWTATTIIAPPLMKRVYHAIADLVSDNAKAKVSPAAALWMTIGLVAYASPRNYPSYVNQLWGAVRGRSWTKPLILDQFLTDIFLRQWKLTKPDFATLFLNAGAHIQHHYMFNSATYAGPLRNPAWYIASDVDPVLAVYELYDRIVGQVADACLDARLLLATGLHQDPHPELTIYWRLADHAAYLTKVGVPFVSVEPLMSRDFVVRCTDERQALAAAQRLEQICSTDGIPLFEVDNRGTDLFVMFTWPHDIGDDFEYRVGVETRRDLKRDVAFVAIKNGRHNGTGYLIDTAETSGNTRTLPLADLPEMIAQTFGVDLSIEKHESNLEAA